MKRRSTQLGYETDNRNIFHQQRSQMCLFETRSDVIKLEIGSKCFMRRVLRNNVIRTCAGVSACVAVNHVCCQLRDHELPTKPNFSPHSFSRKHKLYLYWLSEV